VNPILAKIVKIVFRPHFGLAAVIVVSSILGACVMRHYGAGIRQIALQPPVTDTQSNHTSHAVFLFWSNHDKSQVFRGRCGYSQRGKIPETIFSPQNCTAMQDSVIRSRFQQSLERLSETRFESFALKTDLAAKAAIESDLADKISQLSRQMEKLQSDAAKSLLQSNIDILSQERDRVLKESLKVNAEREALREQEKPARELVRNALSLIDSPAPFNLEKCGSPAAICLAFDIIWEAFEDAKPQDDEPLTDPTPSPAARSLALRSFLETQSIRLDLSVVEFPRTTKGAELQQNSLVFSARGVAHGSAVLTWTLQQRLTSERGLKIERLLQLDPRANEGLCKVWIPPDVFDDNSKSIKIGGSYSSLQESDPQLSVITFVRDEPRKTPGIAKLFFATCGFAHEDAYAADQDLLLWETREERDTEVFTVGDFFDVMSRNVLKMEFVE
jgi:hypothetical protein